jgi:hypothetical protein
VSARSAIINPVGDQHAADRIIVGLTTGGTTVRAYLDLDFVRVGRAIALFSLVNAGVIFDSGLQAKLAQTVARRLAADLGRVR